MADSIESGLAAVRGLLHNAMEDAGRSIEQYVKAGLDKPVGRDFAGNVDERSKIGEWPRRETGLLQAGISSAVTEDTDITLTMISEREGEGDIPRRLTDPNELARPYWQDTHAHIQDDPELITTFIRAAFDV